MEKKKSIDILELGQKDYNIHYNNLKSTKKSLKNDSTIIESFIKSMSDHKRSLKKIIEQIKQFSETEKPFPILKKIEIIIKLYYKYYRSFIDSFKSTFKNINQSIIQVMNELSNYLNSSQLLLMNINGMSEKYFEKYDILMKSLEMTEMSIIEDYTMSKYKIQLKEKNKDKDHHAKESLILERDFLDFELELKNKVNNFIDEYNSNMKLIKPKIIKLNEDVSNDLSKIFQDLTKKYDNFKKEINEGTNKLNDIDKNLNNNGKNEIENFLNYVIEKDNEDCEIFQPFHVNKYNIKIIQQEEKHLIENNISVSKPKNKKSAITLNYTHGDIYNMVKILYDYKFEMVNKDSYILEEENDKIIITGLMGKLLNYNFDTRIGGNEKSITQEENNNLLNMIFINDKYFMQFLLCLNNFRTQGRFEMSKELFEEIVSIFNKESINLKTKNNPDISNLIIILSQTYYQMKDNTKHFLQNEVRKNEFFRSSEFWYKHFDESIEKELANFEKDIIKNGITYPEMKKQKKINEILFSKFASYSTCINGFELENEKIDEILNPLFDKYNISDEFKESILQLIKVNK